MPVIKLLKVVQQVLKTHQLVKVKINMVKTSMWCEMGVIERYCQGSLWSWWCGLTSLRCTWFSVYSCRGGCMGIADFVVSFCNLFETHYAVQVACNCAVSIIVW